MILKTKLLGHVYEFKSVKDALAKANEEKSGDRLAGIAAENAEERVAAKVGGGQPHPGRSAGQPRCSLRGGRGHPHHPGRREREDLRGDQELDGGRAAGVAAG